jgi:hypothetical protein
MLFKAFNFEDKQTKNESVVVFVATLAFMLFNFFCSFVALNFIHIWLYAFQNVGNMVIPLHAGVGHAETDLCIILHGIVLSFFCNLHSTVEMLCWRIVVTLLRQEFTELHKGTCLTLAILEFRRQLKISLHKHLELVLVHGGVNIAAANLAQVTDGNRLTSNWRHLNGIAQGKLMVDRRFLVVANTIVDDT